MKWISKYQAFNLRFKIHQFILLKSLLLTTASMLLLLTRVRMEVIAFIETIDLVLSTILYTTFSILSKRNNSRYFSWFLFFELMLFIVAYWIVYILGGNSEFIYFRIIFREFPLVLFFGHIASRDIMNGINQINLNSRLSEMRSEIYRLIFRFIPLNTILILISHFIFNLIFEPKNAPQIANIYLLLVIVRIIYTENFLIGIYREKTLQKVAIIQFVTALVLGIWWMQVWGILGLSTAILCAIIVAKIYSIIKLRKLKISINQYLPTKQFLIFSTFLLIAFIVETIIY